jgi:tetracenomycin A2 monooxygenase-dioxygenase
VGRVAAEQGSLRAQDIYTRFGFATATNTEALARQIGVVPVLAGYHYVSRAVVPEHAGNQETFVTPKVSADGEPGTRAPHAWIERQGRRISTLDLFGRNFVLLTGQDGAAWQEAASSVSQSTGLPLDVYSIGPSGELSDPNENWLFIYGITPAGAVLVRPDGFVAGRVYAHMPKTTETLLAAINSLLSRTA